MIKFKYISIVSLCVFIVSLYACDDNEQLFAKSIDGDWKATLMIPERSLNLDFIHDNEYKKGNEGETKASIFITEHFKSDISNPIVKESLGDLEFIIVLEKNITMKYFMIDNKETGLWLGHSYIIDSLYAPSNINIAKSQIISSGNKEQKNTETEYEFKKRILEDYINNRSLFSDLSFHEEYDELIREFYRNPAPFKLIDDKTFQLGDSTMCVIFKSNSND